MRPITKGIVGAVMGLSLLAPLAAGAAGLTSAQVSAIVSLLQSFGADNSTITNVQLVLNGQKPNTHREGDNDDQGHGRMSSTTPNMGMPPGQVGKMACITLSRNLGPGSKGDDVKKLQELLSEDHDAGFMVMPTGVFGPATMKAMMKFQMKNGISSSTTGIVGPLTRGFFERACGKGLGHGDDPVPMIMNGISLRGTVSTVATGTQSFIVIQPTDAMRTVMVSASTTIMVFAPMATSTSTSTPPMPPMPTAGTFADIVSGRVVQVDGKLNTDGSVNAAHINVGLTPLSLPPGPAH